MIQTAEQDLPYDMLGVPELSCTDSTKINNAIDARSYAQIGSHRPPRD